ncbi:MAG: IclR family transcriptional regulator [Clostridiaceae bacterium]|nr:IclR family transcriptional regulator [Clostridiaceae bacterium]
MAPEGNTVIQSVNRAIQIIRCFEDNEELGVTEIGRMIGLHKSTAFGLISTLEANKLLEKNDNTGKYKLGLELFRLGTKVNSTLRHIAIPYLEQLVRMYQETVNLVVIDDLYVIYLEKVESTRSMHISTMVGGRLPLYCTAVGKAMMANLPGGELENKLDRMEFIKYTDKTICDKGSIMESLERDRRNGYSEDNEELEIGLSCIAAPIYNHFNIPFAAISLSGPTFRMNKSFRKEIGLTLIKYTREISVKLGYREDLR